MSTTKRFMVVDVLRNFEEGLLFNELVDLLDDRLEDTTRYGGKSATVRQFVSQLKGEGLIRMSGDRIYVTGTQTPVLPTRNLVPRWSGAQIDITFDSNHMDNVVRIDFSRDRERFDPIPLGRQMTIHVGDSTPDWPRAVILMDVVMLRFHYSDGTSIRIVDCQDYGNRAMTIVIVNNDGK